MNKIRYLVQLLSFKILFYLFKHILIMLNTIKLVLITVTILKRNELLVACDYWLLHEVVSLLSDIIVQGESIVDVVLQVQRQFLMQA